MIILILIQIFAIYQLVPSRRNKIMVVLSNLQSKDNKGLFVFFFFHNVSIYRVLYLYKEGLKGSRE